MGMKNLNATLAILIILALAFFVRNSSITGQGYMTYWQEEDGVYVYKKPYNPSWQNMELYYRKYVDRTAIRNDCNDTDGIRPHVRGAVIGPPISRAMGDRHCDATYENNTFNDCCINEQYVVENFCDKGRANMRIYKCINECKWGRCIDGAIDHLYKFDDLD